MLFINREIKPRDIKINGMKYPAIWSFKAIAKMEDYTGTSHLYTLARFDMNVYTAKEMIGALAGMLSAAGVVCMNAAGEDVLAETIELSINPHEETEIIAQLKKIIADQGDQPDGDSKNV